MNWLGLYEGADAMAMTSPVLQFMQTMAPERAPSWPDIAASANARRNASSATFWTLASMVMRMSFPWTGSTESTAFTTSPAALTSTRLMPRSPCRYDSKACSTPSLPTISPDS